MVSDTLRRAVHGTDNDRWVWIQGISSVGFSCSDLRPTTAAISRLCGSRKINVSAEELKTLPSTRTQVPFRALPWDHGGEDHSCADTLGGVYKHETYNRSFADTYGPIYHLMHRGHMYSVTIQYTAATWAAILTHRKKTKPIQNTTTQ